jgi:hypothetical protein
MPLFIFARAASSNMICLAMGVVVVLAGCVGWVVLAGEDDAWRSGGD